jgi:hypothetical protein
VFLGNPTADSQLVAIAERHEYIHHYLTVSTTYGDLIRQARHRAPELLPALVNDCRIVQEMCATYVSLIDYSRQDVVLRLPSQYQVAFARCPALVDRAFSTTLLRAQYAIALARSTMMIGHPSHTVTGISLDNPLFVIRDYSHLIQRLGQGESLPSHYSPDARLSIIERRLSSLPDDAIQLALREQVPAAFHAVDAQSDFAPSQHVGRRSRCRR